MIMISGIGANALEVKDSVNLHRLKVTRSDGSIFIVGNADQDCWAIRAAISIRSGQYTLFNELLAIRNPTTLAPDEVLHVADLKPF